MLFLVKDILDYSQIESNSLILNKSNTHVADLLNECISVLGFKANEKGIALSVQESAVLEKEVYTDANRVK